MKVVLAEKPSVARDIARVLGAAGRKEDHYTGGGWTVTWALGHLLEIAPPEKMNPAWEEWDPASLPMIPSAWSQVARDGASKHLRAVSKLLKEAELVVAATDAGREGEHIFRLIYAHSRSKAPVKRLWISSLTSEAIRAGFAALHPGEKFDPLAAAASARAHADWLVGMNATRAYTLRNGTKCTVGRVQTPTLALLVRRHHEIAAFKPTPYAEIVVTLEPGFRARLLVDGKPHIGDVGRARAILAEITPLPWARVRSVETKEQRTPAPPLFNLLALQKEANKRFGFTAARVLALAQELYESKLLTYPRTESRHLSTDMVGELPRHVAALSQAYPAAAAAAGAGLARGLKLGKAYVDDTKLTDHHAIIPTTQAPTPDLGGDARRLYDLVARRFLAVFLPPRVTDETVALFDLGAHTLRTTGSQLKDPGWTIAEAEAARAGSGEEAEDKAEQQTLPPLEAGQLVKKRSQQLLEKTTKPPKPYTDASLLDAMKTAGRQVSDEELAAFMKENGLGTPATRAATIEKLLAVGYAERKKKAIVPTAKGIALIAQVEPALADPLLTAQWEERLARIEDGKAQGGELERDVASWVRELIPAVLRSKPMAEETAHESFGPCPKCKEGVVRKTPKGWGCSRYKNAGCTFGVWAKSFGHKVSEAELQQLLADGVTKKPVKLTRKDGSGTYEAPLRLSDEWKVVPQVVGAADAETFGLCPLCKEGAVVATPKGWGCSRFKSHSCKLAIWSDIAQHKLTAAEVRELVATGETKTPASFYSTKNKTNFQARLKLDETGRAVLVFDQAKTS